MRRKLKLGGWFLPVLRLLHHGRRLRGTAFDPFGYAHVRRVERSLPGEYLTLVDRALERLSPDTLATAIEIAQSQVAKAGDTLRTIKARMYAPVIDLLRAKGDPAGLPPDERDIVVYARQLMRSNRVDQAVFDTLKQRHGVQWLVELTAVANFYVALCGVVNAFEVPAPDGGDRFA